MTANELKHIFCDARCAAMFDLWTQRGVRSAWDEHLVAPLHAVEEVIRKLRGAWKCRKVGHWIETDEFLRFHFPHRKDVELFCLRCGRTWPDRRGDSHDRN